MWQKNQVFVQEIIQPLFDLADPTHNIHKEVGLIIAQKANKTKSHQTQVQSGNEMMQFQQQRSQQQQPRDQTNRDQMRDRDSRDQQRDQNHLTPQHQTPQQQAHTPQHTAAAVVGQTSTLSPPQQPPITNISQWQVEIIHFIFNADPRSTFTYVNKYDFIQYMNFLNYNFAINY